MGKYKRGMLDKKHSEETKKKLSEASKKLWQNKDYRDRVTEIQTGESSSRWKGGYALRDVPTYDEYACRISYAEPVRRNEIDENILEVKCTYCGKWFIPRRINVTNRIRSLEGIIVGECRLYCSDKCKKECPVFAQILHYKGTENSLNRETQPQLRQIVFERDNYTCKKCRKTKDELEVGLHCHHIEGIRWEPLESTDIDKCITYCKTCHEKTHKKDGCTYDDMKCK